MKVYSKSIFERAVRLFNPKNEPVQEYVSDVIQPTIEMEPIIKCASLIGNAIANTIFTSATNKKTYLVGYVANISKDSGSTATEFKPYTYINGQITYLFKTALMPSVDLHYSVSHTFKHPLLIDKGAVVRMSLDLAGATLTYGMTLYYYEDED